MRILYIHQYFNLPSSSGGIRSYEMAKRLVQDGNQVDMITTSAKLENEYEFKKGWNMLNVDGINLHVLKLPYSNNNNYMSRLLKFFSFAFKTCFYCLKLKSDIIFASSTPLTIAIPAVYLKKTLKIPMVFEVRDLWPEVPVSLGIIKNKKLIKLAQTLEYIAYKNSKSIIALSPGMKEGILKSYPQSNVTVIPNAADIDLFSRKTSANSNQSEFMDKLANKKIALYTGAFGFVNNLSYLIDVAQHTLNLDPNTIFILVGDGREKSLIENRARIKGVLNKNFFILEPVAKNQLPNLVRKCTVTISTVLPVPELWHNSANKFFDALAAGKPIAINHYGWQAEIINYNQVGIVMDPNNSFIGAKKLIAKMNNEMWLENCSKNSVSLAKNMFSREKLFEQFKSVLYAAK